MFLTVALAVTAVVLLLGYFHHHHQYWQAKGVFVPPSLPIVGHAHQVFLSRVNRFERCHKIFQKTKATLIGKYEVLIRTLVVRDLGILKSILVKDFGHFMDRRVIRTGNKEEQFMNESVITTTGEKWRTLRTFISPFFTSGKLRDVFPTVEAKCKKLVDWCMKNDQDKVDVKDIFGRYSLDVIIPSAFGVDCNSIENGNEDFVKGINSIANPQFSIKGLFLVPLILLAPWSLEWLGIPLLQPSFNVFIETARKTLQLRRKAETKRKDFVDLMMNARSKQEEQPDGTKYPITDTTIQGMMVLFLIGGFDTVAVALTFSSYLLARHPDVQERIRKELRDLSETHGELNYEALREAKFLDACFHECLRLYPPGPLLERVCTKDYHIEGTEITLRKGDIVEVPVWTINRDPDIWEDPEDFKPERFLSENKTQEQAFAFQAFGQGPRNCVGMRFALMETKLVLAHLVLSFELQLAQGHEEPPEIIFSFSALRTKEPIYLKFKPLEESA